MDKNNTLNPAPRRHKPGPAIVTARHQIAWSYANLARAHVALVDCRTKYKTTDHMVRARLFKGLCTGTMTIGSIFDDEKLRLSEEKACTYCKATEYLSFDHLIPRSAGGKDDGANLVLACRSCNSSKGTQNLLQWFAKRDQFPRLMLLRRYIKLVATDFEEKGLLDCSLDNLPANLPFDVRQLPTKLPPLAELCL